MYTVRSRTQDKWLPEVPIQHTRSDTGSQVPSKHLLQSHPSWHTQPPPWTSPAPELPFPSPSFWFLYNLSHFWLQSRWPSAPGSQALSLLLLPSLPFSLTPTMTQCSSAVGSLISTTDLFSTHQRASCPHFFSFIYTWPGPAIPLETWSDTSHGLWEDMFPVALFITAKKYTKPNSHQFVDRKGVLCPSNGKPLSNKRGWALVNAAMWTKLRKEAWAWWTYLGISCLFPKRMSGNSSGKRVDYKKRRAYAWTRRAPTCNGLGWRKEPKKEGLVGRRWCHAPKPECF